MKKLSLLVIMLMTALMLAACGGGGSEGEAAAPAEPTGTTLDYVGYDEFRYDPETAEVATGTDVTINFKNDGALEHNWLLASSRVDVTDVTESDALAGATSGVIAGGTDTTFTFTAPPPGEYKIVCTVPGHAAAGMVADFIVTP